MTEYKVVTPQNKKVKEEIKIDKSKKKNRKIEFSKLLIIQESILIWIETISMIILAFICVAQQAFAELPWLTAMVALPWTAYGASQIFYYKKAEKENTTGGIVYESAMQGLTTKDDNPAG